MQAGLRPAGAIPIATRYQAAGHHGPVQDVELPRAIILQPNDGCLTLARALVRRGVEVRVLANPEYSYVVASRGVEGEVMPEPLLDPSAWLDVLTELGEAGGGVVFSGSDSATEWLTEHRAATAGLASKLRVDRPGPCRPDGQADACTRSPPPSASGCRPPTMSATKRT